MHFSFWEYNNINSKENCIVIGSGIVGLSTAIEIKKRHPSMPVLVVEKYYPPQGASTKNAGFACFGSVTELIDDLDHMSKQSVIEIVKMRWQGIQLLNERLSSNGISIDFDGGKELFDKNEFVTDKEIKLCNEIMLLATGIENYFTRLTNDDFSSLNAQCLGMHKEGQLDPMVMVETLNNIAIEVGVKFLYGHAVSDINFRSKQVVLNENIKLDFNKLFICTNGFTQSLLPNLEVNPARNHVMITNELDNLQWKGVYHYDKGYYYFRRVGNRILLGGARNFDPSKEDTNSFEFNEKIKTELIRFLNENIAPGMNARPMYWWTGILGVGPSKYPIIKEIEKDCYLGVRLGGMGVAIGSFLGKEVVNLAFDN
jgi:gamma-glutamylputrescine oxidase